MADADGLLMSSTEGEPFLVLNGTQTQSAPLQCLLGDSKVLRAAGVSRLRLSPCAEGFVRVLDDFEAVMNAGASAAERVDQWPSLGVPFHLSNGYPRRLPGMAWSDA